MLLKIRHALIEISNQPTTRKSAIVINNEIIITSGCLLQPYVRPIPPRRTDGAEAEACVSTKIVRKLQQCQLINVQDDSSEEAKFLDLFSCRVMFDNRRSKYTPSDERQPHILSRYSAKMLYLFCPIGVSRAMHIFADAAHTTKESVDNEILRASFAILSMRPNSGAEAFERFLLHISRYLRYLHPIHTLDDVLTICTPFGLENFYKTVSIGKVSNVIGREGSLFALSNNLPLGCEGSAVFNNKLRLIGIIICTSFTYQLENVNLTLAANFAQLLRSFMKQLGIEVTSLTLPREPSTFAWETAMVVIECAGNQGTGTFVKVHNKKFILTCAHVVSELNSKIVCRSIDHEFQSEVLWHNPQYNEPFDVAVLTVPNNIPERQCVRLSLAKPFVGQAVYNAGFPYFVNFDLKYDFNPSIFQGRIIKCATGAIMSDGCVQAGQSGGPMFDQNGNILGICVSNLKMDNVVYPNINTAVPIYDIRKSLESYSKTNDINVLDKLIANEETQKSWSIDAPQMLSKL